MRNRKVKIISLITAVLMLSALVSETFAEVLGGFSQVNSYNDYTYADVSQNDWFWGYAGFAYEYGIMTGTADRIFSPNGKLTLAEAVTVAARLNAAHYGNIIDTNPGNIRLAASDARSAYPVTGNGEFDLYNGAHEYDGAKTGRYFRSDSLAAALYSSEDVQWFLPYLAYALREGIVSENSFGGRYFEAATREELAYLLYRALPDCYGKINDISPLPDVNAGSTYYPSILALYEAGVITGNDEFGTFYPYSSIVRSEVAAMVSRAINTDLRVRFTLNPNIPLKNLYFSWKYPSYGADYSLNLQISYYDYNYFNVKRRVYDYTVYATDDADVTGLSTLAYTLKSIAEDNGYTSAYDIAGFISAFVQSIQYMDDMAAKGIAEYPKYPIETLFEQNGDCEDKAALLAKLLKLLGYGSVLLVSRDHMAVGLQTSGNGNLSYDGANYYYIETTEPGWRVGEVPGDMLGVGMEVLYI